MRIGYARVSTRDQNPDAQKDALAAVGCEKVFIDNVSGKLARRPELDKALLTANREGDQLVVTKLVTLFGVRRTGGGRWMITAVLRAPRGQSRSESAVGRERATSGRIRVAAGAAVVALWAVGCAAGTPTSAAAGGSTASPAGALPAPRDVGAVGGSSMKALGEPDWALGVGGGVWVAGVGTGLRRYDAATGATTDEQMLDWVCLGMDQGFGSVWAASCSFEAPVLARLDPLSGAVRARIALPAPPAQESSVGAGEGAVWLLTSDGTHLLAIDPGSNAVRRSYPAPANAAAVRAGLGAVWVTGGASGRLLRLDPATGATVATVMVGRGAGFLALGPDAVWVLNTSDGTVSRVDPRTNAVTATITVASGAVDGGDIAAGADAVWVRVTDALAVRIDPKTNTVTERLGPRSGSGGVAIADRWVWLTAHDVQTIWRLPR
jgi:virginiamycin B lyase